MIKYKHKKTGNLYEVINMDVIDKNTDRNDDTTVYYTDGTKVYIRRYEEFCKKIVKNDIIL